MSRPARSLLRIKLRVMLASASVLLLIPVVAASLHLARVMDLNRRLQQVDATLPRSGIALTPADRQHRELEQRIAAAGDRAFRDVITLASLSLVVLITLTLVAPSRLLHPLTRLANLIRQAEGGNLRVVLDRVDPDEIGELAARLQRMLSELDRFDELKRTKISHLAAQRDQLIDLLPQPAVLVDRDGRVLRASQSFCRCFGADPAALVEQRLVDALGWHDTGIGLLAVSTEPTAELDEQLGGKRYHVRTIPGRNGDASAYRLLLFSPATNLGYIA